MTEKNLIKGLRRGEKKCFDELFELYYDKCYTYAMSLVKNTSATEDVIQNVFLKIWLGRTALDPSQNFGNYIITAVRNESISYLRLKYNRCKSGSDVPEVEDSTVDIMERLVLSETDSRIRDIIENMPEQRKKAFVMNRYDGKTAKQIASEMSLSQRTVERHIALAMADIRKGMS